jgi:hypothetical protein
MAANDATADSATAVRLRRTNLDARYATLSGLASIGSCRRKAPEIVAERGDRSITLARILLERFGDNRVEVAAQRAAASFGCTLRCARRFEVDDRLDQVSGRAQSRAGRVLAGQQDVQEHSQRIHVGRRRHRRPRNLLGRGIFRREGGAAVARQLRCRRCVSFILQQLGDAEIEQLHLAVVVDQHIRRLDVPVNDQVGVRVRNGIEHLEK